MLGGRVEPTDDDVSVGEISVLVNVSVGALVAAGSVGGVVDGTIRVG